MSWTLEIVLLPETRSTSKLCKKYIQTTYLCTWKLSKAIVNNLTITIYLISTVCSTDQWKEMVTKTSHRWSHHYQVEHEMSLSIRVRFCQVLLRNLKNKSCQIQNKRVVKFKIKVVKINNFIILDHNTLTRFQVFYGCHFPKTTSSTAELWKIITYEYESSWVCLI